jgi:dehydrogenase/reductase SDR family protein 4
MRRRFEGKVVLTTASSTGIGFGISKRLAEEGAHVIISSRSQKNVDEAVKKLTDRGLKAVGCVCHVGNKEHRQNLFNFVKEKFGRLDVLVPNAAVSTAYGGLFDTTEAQFDKMFAINVKSVFFMVQEFLPLMKRGKPNFLNNRFQHLTQRFLRRLQHRHKNRDLLSH